MADLRTYTSNAFETTLDGTLAAGATTVDVQSTDGSPTVPFYLVVDPASDDRREVILVDGSKTSTAFVLSGVSGRGQDGTDDVEHESGAPVVVVPVAAHINDLHDRVDANGGKADDPHGNEAHDADFATESYVDTAVDNATFPSAGVRAHASAAQAIPKGTSAKINIDTTASGDDPDGLLDATNRRIVFDRAGWWQVNGGVGYAAASDSNQRQARIHRNSSLYALANIPAIAADATTGVTVSALVWGDVGDYVELFGLQNASGSSLDTSSSSFFTFLSASYQGT